MNEESMYTRLVAYAERITHTDLEYLFTNGFWLTVSQIGIGLIALFVSIAFARFVPKDAYGTYRLFLSYFWIITAFSLSGLGSALVRVIARGEEGSYIRAFGLSLRWSFPMILIGLCFSGYYLLHGNIPLGIGMALIGILGPFFQASYLFSPYLEGKKDFKNNALFGLILNGVPALALFVTMFLSIHPLVFFAVYLGTNIVTGFALSYIAARIHPPNTLEDKGLSETSRHWSVMNILSVISQEVDSLLVFHYLGAAELALYSFATAMPDQIKNMFSNVANLAFPKFAQRPLSEIKSTINYRTFIFTLFVLLSTILYIIAAPLLFKILFPAYVGSIFYSQLYALALIPIGNMIPTTALQAHAKNRELYVINTAGPFFQIGALFVGIVWFGIIGIIVARIFSRAFYFILCFGLLAGATRKSHPTYI